MTAEVQGVEVRWNMKKLGSSPNPHNQLGENMEDKLLKYMLIVMAVTLTIWLITASIVIIGGLIKFII